jgi:DNA-binding HxlR family transcriptional regulator
VGRRVCKRNALVIEIARAQHRAMGRTAEYSLQICSVAATLEVVGDPWTLLILRDAFADVRRFEQWQERLGVARNVLAARLKSLVGHGVLEKRLYNAHPPRHEYALTDKGRDLYGVLVTMAAWGDRHVYCTAGPVAVVHRACGAPFEPRVVCDACGEEVGPGDLERSTGHATTTVGEALTSSATPSPG